MRNFTLLGILIILLSLFLSVITAMFNYIGVYGQGSLIASTYEFDMFINFIIFIIGILCIFLPAWYRNDHLRKKAKQREKALDYDTAITIWEELKDYNEAARVRKLKAKQDAIKVTQKIVHGDEVTEIKDSVVSKSNVGGSGSSKAEELREAKALLDEGVIEDDEFKQMKKDIMEK